LTDEGDFGARWAFATEANHTVAGLAKLTRDTTSFRGLEDRPGHLVAASTVGAVHHLHNIGLHVSLTDWTFIVRIVPIRRGLGLAAILQTHT